MEKVDLIKGGVHKDERGVIRFVNDFDLLHVRRFYHIHHSSINIIRAWQGHQIESKWFHCTKGAFVIKVIQIDNWENPSKKLEILSFELSAKESNVLHIPGGYVNGFKAVEKESSLLVFSDKDLKASKDDDYRFNKNYWQNW